MPRRMPCRSPETWGQMAPEPHRESTTPEENGGQGRAGGATAGARCVPVHRTWSRIEGASPPPAPSGHLRRAARGNTHVHTVPQTVLRSALGLDTDVRWAEVRLLPEKRLLVIQDHHNKTRGANCFFWGGGRPNEVEARLSAICLPQLSYMRQPRPSPFVLSAGPCKGQHRPAHGGSGARGPDAASGSTMAHAPAKGNWFVDKQTTVQQKAG